MPDIVMDGTEEMYAELLVRDRKADEDEKAKCKQLETELAQRLGRDVIYEYPRELVKLWETMKHSSCQCHLIRLDALPDKDPFEMHLMIQSLIDKYASLFWLAVHEVPEPKLTDGADAEANPHYHVLLFSDPSEHKESAIRQFITRSWRGNKQYSMKKGVTDAIPDQILYLCKGKGSGSGDRPEVTHRSPAFTDQMISVFHAGYWKNNAKVQVAISSKKRKREMSVHENILNLCRARGYTDSDRAKIFDVVMEYYRRKIKYLNPTYVRNLVHQTAVYLSPGGPAELNLRDFCVGIPY